jgi:RHS repeat-associated protein
LNDDQYGTGWHMRHAALPTEHVGKTIEDVYLVNDTNNPGGYWNAAFTDIALVSADGTVRRIYSRDESIALTPFSSSGVSAQTYAVNHFSGAGPYVPETTVYYHGDHLGSSRQMSNANAYPVWEATYLPYGQERAVAGGSSTSPNHYKFTGKERDSESGLDYFGARYYASALGRFIGTDPIVVTPDRMFDPQQFNLYGYVRDNPLRFIDPTGMELTVSGNVKQAMNELCAIVGGGLQQHKLRRRNKHHYGKCLGGAGKEQRGAGLDSRLGSK